MFSEQLKRSCQIVADAVSRDCEKLTSFWENEFYRETKKIMLDRLNSLSHKERLTYMFLLGRIETQDVVSSVNVEDKNAEQHPDKPAKEFEISQKLKALLELSNEEFPYYRQVSAMGIRGILSSFVMCVEESAHDGGIEEDTNTKAKRRDAGNDDSINANITNVDDRSCELHKKESVKKALLSWYKSVEVSAHKLLHYPLPRIAQLMCSMVVRSVIAAVQIEHSDVNSRETQVDAKLFELLVELVEHPVLLSFAVALQRVRKCYLIDKLCAKVYLGKEINVKGQETLQTTLIYKELSKQQEEQNEQIHVTSTTASSNDDNNDNISMTTADTKVTTSLSSLHTVAHQAMLSPSHKNYKKLLLCCNNTKLLTEIVCNPAIYSTLPANVIHHLTLMHPRVMLNCVQELTCRHHLAVKVTSNVYIDTKQNVNTVKANSTSGQKGKPQQPCQVKQKSKEIQSMRTQYKRKKKEMLTSTTVCEKKNVEAMKHDNKIHNIDSSAANNVELEVSMSLIPFLLKVYQALVHKRQPASVIDAATMFVFGTVTDFKENTNCKQQNENVCKKTEVDALTHNGSAYLDLVHFPCSDDKKNKLIQRYFEWRPRLVARYILQHLHELPSTLHLEIQRNMCKHENHQWKCCTTTSLPSSSTSTSSNVVSLESTSCHTFSEEVNKEFHWLTDLITCGKVRNIVQCYAQLQPELRALIYEKNKAALQSSSRQWRRSEHFTNVNGSDDNVIIDLPTLFSIPDATRRADEGRRHFVHGDRYFEDDDATRISYLSLLPVHEAIALADANEYIHNKEVSIRSAVASTLIAGLPFQSHHDNTQKATELQENFANKEGKEDHCEEQETQEENKTISTESTSVVVASDQDNMDVMKVLQYCMERVNEQDPWKCAVMYAWSELPCKVWKVSQRTIDNVDNKHINNITIIHQDQCLNGNQNTANKAQCHKLQQQCESITSSSCSTSSSYEHVSLLLAYIQKCMSAKDISRGTLQHIALLLLKVLRALYYTCDHADMTEADKKSVANVDEKLNSVKETILEMWIKLVMQRKTITHNEKRVLVTAPEKLVSVIFEKLTETMLKEWLHVDKSERVLNDNHQALIEALINVVVSANTNSNEKSDDDIAENVDKEQEREHDSDCTSNRKKVDSYAVSDMSEESQAIKLILTQTFTIKEAQTFLHNGMELFLSAYCIDYRRHYSPHLCVMAVELFFHFFTKQEQIAFVEQLLNAVFSIYGEEKKDNRPSVNNNVVIVDENVKSEENLKQTGRKISLSFVSLPEIKLIIEKYLQGKYLTYVLEHLREQEEEEEEHCKLQNNTQIIATDISAENDRTDNIIKDSVDCRASQSEVVHPRLTQFACDLRKYMKEHSKGNSNNCNVFIGNDDYDFTFTCRFCKYWNATQQQKYARIILHAVTHRYASDLFTQRELFRMLGMMPDLSLSTLPLRTFIVFTSSASQSSPEPLSSLVTTIRDTNCNNDNDDNDDVVDTPESEAVNTACNSEKETNELSYDKEFVRSLAIQLLGKLYDHDSFDLLVELLHVDALVKEAFAALRNRFAFMLHCSGSNSGNNNAEKVFSLITSISNKCAKVSVLKELLRYVGSMQSECAFQWLLEYGQKCKEAQLATKESSWKEEPTTSTETSASETSLAEDSEEHSNNSEEWEKLDNDEMEEDDSNNSSEDNNEENESISVEEGVNKVDEEENDNDDDVNHNTKEVAGEHEKEKEHAESKKYLRNKIHGMHKDVFLAYLSALINFIDKEEVWNVMQSATQCTEIKHQVLICNVICAIADVKIANVAWKRTQYTHLLLQLLQNAITEIQQRKGYNNSNNTKNRSKQEAAKSIIRTVFHKIIDSRVDGISNTLFYEDVVLYPLCYNIMNKLIWTCNINDTEQQEVNAKIGDESDDEQQEELSLLSLKCLLYCSNVSVQELVKEILNVAEDWQLVKRIEQVEEVHDDFENSNNYTNHSNKGDKTYKTHQDINDDANTRATAETNAAHTTAVSKIAITLIDYLLREQRQPVLIIHLLLCTQNPQEKWIKYITQMHNLDLLHPDVMSKCIDVFKVDDSEAYYNYYRYENNARAFATAHIERYKEELLTLEQTIMRHHTLPFVRRLGVDIVTYFEHYYRCDSNNEDDNDSTDGNSAINKAERIKQCQDAILQYRNDKERWICDAAMLVRLPKRK